MKTKLQCHEKNSNVKDKLKNIKKKNQNVKNKDKKPRKSF